MSKVKEDISRVRLEVDGKQGINTLGKLEMEAKQLQIDMKNAKKGTDEYVAANKKLTEVKNQITRVRTELGLTGMTMSQLTRYQRDLVREMNNTTTRGTARYRELNAEIQRVNGAIRQQRAELNGTAGFFSKIGKELKTFGVLALGYLGVSAFMSQVQSLISGSSKLSDELADIQKTTGLADAELSKLSKTIKQMDTRSSRAELRGLAEIAGRLGLKSVKDIEGFVNAADKINVALGDVLGEPEKVMKELGKLTSTFGVTKEFGIEESLLRVGSAINELGMASTANEGYMVEFTKRMGGIAPLAKISIQNILGMGATLDSLGQTSEVSTTALSKLFIAMAKNSEAFAKFANMEGKEFVKLLNEDANEAFLRMLEGVKNNSNGITELAATLGDLEQDGGRVVGVLGTLANNTETLRKQQEISNKAFQEGSSVVSEFNIKNENMAANLAKVQKWLAGLFVNSDIMNGLNRFVGMWANWLKIPISQKMREEQIELQKLHSQILTTNMGSAERIKLINELKGLYPSHLSNINAETVSNKELSLAVKSVNDQLINKIILQKEDEKIQEQNNTIAEKRMEIFEREDKIREMMIKTAEKYGIEIKEAATFEEQALQVLKEAREEQKKTTMSRGRLFDSLSEYSFQLAQLKDAQGFLNGMENQGNKLLEEKNKLIQRLGITMEDTKPVAGGDFVIPDDPTTDTGTPISVTETPATKAQLKELEQMEAQWIRYQERILQITRDYESAGLSGQEAELQKVKHTYFALEDELVTHLKNKMITREQFDAEMLNLKQMRQGEENRITEEYAAKAAEAKANAERQITEATAEERQLAILKTNEHYDQLIALAQQFGLDTVAIEEERRKSLLEIQAKHDQKEIAQAAAIADAKQMIAQGLGQAISGVIDFIGNRQGELTSFQKILTGANIALDTAAALGKIVPLALEASKGTGPAAPFVFAGYLASMAGTVIGAIGKAKQALSSSNVPEWTPASGEEKKTPTRRDTSAVTKSFYFGGPTDEGMGFGDKYGEFAGFVHRREYVVPEIVASDPWVANLLPAIEAVRQDKIRGFAQGGETSSGTMASGGGGMSDPEIKQLLIQIVKNTSKIPEKLRAYLVYNDLEEMQEEMETLKERYRA